jgi:hypothetical protein
MVTCFGMVSSSVYLYLSIIMDIQCPDDLSGELDNNLHQIC